MRARAGTRAPPRSIPETLLVSSWPFLSRGRQVVHHSVAALPHAMPASTKPTPLEIVAMPTGHAARSKNLVHPMPSGAAPPSAWALAPSGSASIDAAISVAIARRHLRCLMTHLLAGRAGSWERGRGRPEVAPRAVETHALAVHPMAPPRSPYTATVPPDRLGAQSRQRGTRGAARHVHQQRHPVLAARLAGAGFGQPPPGREAMRAGGIQRHHEHSSRVAAHRSRAAQRLEAGGAETRRVPAAAAIHGPHRAQKHERDGER